MKKVEAIIRPSVMDAVRSALNELGIVGMTFIDAVGLGRQEGYSEIHRGIEFKNDYLSKIKLEVLVDDNQLQSCIDAILVAGRTGKIGDGKITVSSVEQVIRIRTGERDREAMK